MKLDKLIESREGISDITFPVLEKELLSRFEQLYTGAVNDVLREFCLLDQALPGHILPLREYRTVAGFAFTVKSAPNVKVRGEMEFRTRMLDEMGEDHFVMWDTSRDEKATLWGGVMTATAVGKKVKAACIDGGIRDTHQILEQDFPIFYKYRISNGSLGPVPDHPLPNSSPDRRYYHQTGRCGPLVTSMASLLSPAKLPTRFCSALKKSRPTKR